MSEQVKAINQYMKYALEQEIEEALCSLALTERQTKVFNMKYRDGKDIYFIADTISASPDVVNRELKIIRKKLAKKLGF